MKKERAPVTDDALLALKNQLKRAQEAQATYSKFTQAQVGSLPLPTSYTPHHHYLPLLTCTNVRRTWPLMCATWLCTFAGLDHVHAPCERASNPMSRCRASAQAARSMMNSVCMCFLRLQVDDIFLAAAEAANAARLPLAKMAVEETRMGVVEDKVGEPGGHGKLVGELGGQGKLSSVEFVE